jgi:hypothetical protein
MDAEYPSEPAPGELVTGDDPEAVGVAHVPGLRSILEESTATDLPTVPVRRPEPA